MIELLALQANRTWSLVKLPSGKPLLWVVDGFTKLTIRHMVLWRDTKLGQWLKVLHKQKGLIFLKPFHQLPSQLSCGFFCQLLLPTIGIFSSLMWIIPFYMETSMMRFT